MLQLADPTDISQGQKMKRGRSLELVLQSVLKQLMSMFLVGAYLICLGLLVELELDYSSFQGTLVAL